MMPGVLHLLTPSFVHVVLSSLGLLVMLVTWLLLLLSPSSLLASWQLLPVLGVARKTSSREVTEDEVGKGGQDEVGENSQEKDVPQEVVIISWYHASILCS